MTEFTPTMPTELHPVAIEAHRLYTEGGQRLDAESLGTIRGRIGALGEDLDEVFQALAGLTAVALLLQHQGDEEASEAIQGLIRSQGPRFLPHAEAFGFPNPEAVQRPAEEGPSRQVLQKLGSDFTRHRAKQHDGEVPEGAVSAASLMPNPALGPIRRTTPTTRRNKKVGSSRE